MCGRADGRIEGSVARTGRHSMSANRLLRADRAARTSRRYVISPHGRDVGLTRSRGDAEMVGHARAGKETRNLKADRGHRNRT